MGAGLDIATAAGIGVANNLMDIAFARPRQKLQLKGQKEALEQQNAASMDMWEKTNYGAQKAQLNKAGLNPGLLYGQGGAGGTTGSASAMPDSGAKGGGGMDIAGMAQLKLLEAQAEKLKAETRAINTGADKTGAEIPGVLTENQRKEIARKLESNEWMIKEATSTEEYGARADELQARSAQATNIIRMWEDGTMKNMSDAELQNKLKEIGLKDVNIKGKELENIITELEGKMQKALGIDKNAPTWLKVAGRLLIKLLGGQ